MEQQVRSSGATVEKEGFLPVTFEIRASLPSDEVVFVSGSCKELGSWSPQKAVALSTSAEIAPKWSQRLLLPAGKIEYRYIIKRGEVVLRWEDLGKSQRSFELKDCLSLVIDDGSFGEGKDKTVWLDRGWLTDGVQMNLRRNHHDPFVELLQPQKWSLQLVARKPPTEVAGSYGLQPSPDVNDMYIFYAPDPSLLSFDVEVWSVAEEVAEKGSDDTNPYLIGKAVVLPFKFKRNRNGHIRIPLLNHALDVVGTFRCQFLIITPFVHEKNNLSNLERASYLYGKKAELYIGHRGSGASKKYKHNSDDEEDEDEDSDDEHEKKPTKRIKKKPSYSLSAKCAPSVLASPLHSKSPSMKRRTQNKSPAFASRGLAGNITENTILSFVTAAKNGADYIEFDIHLTKDSVPVIAHDMHLHIPTKTIHGNPTHVQVPVNKLMEKKFRQMRRYIPQPRTHTEMFEKVFPEGERRMKRSNSFGDLEDFALYEIGNVEISAPYTTLQEVLLSMPENIGFDVEIKYPETPALRKAVDYHERNHVIDTTLKVVFDYAGNRPIFFSSFDPDICMMINLKQPRYPVFLLTLGGVWQKYEDDRMNGLYEALTWARQTRLRGVAPWTKALMSDLSFVQKAHEAELLVFTWGVHNNEKEHVATQRAAGVDAIISDNILYVKPPVL